MNRSEKTASRPAAEKLIGSFIAQANPHKAQHLMRFFKTGPGEYGHGDRFLGLVVPATRALIRPYRGRLALPDYDALLQSPWHEIRLGALLLLADQAKRLCRQGDLPGLRELAAFYDRRLERANNWDLVDMSVRDIMAAYWTCANATAAERRLLLATWADSGNLWRERAAMVATHAAQRLGSLAETFWLAERFIGHPHDLMHKASGWMLREAGKQDRAALRGFLAVFHQRLPRTALRYAIEHLDADERRKWMAR